MHSNDPIFKSALVSHRVADLVRLALASKEIGGSDHGTSMYLKEAMSLVLDDLRRKLRATQTAEIYPLNIKREVH